MIYDNVFLPLVVMNLKLLLLALCSTIAASNEEQSRSWSEGNKRWTDNNKDWTMNKYTEKSKTWKSKVPNINICKYSIYFWFSLKLSDAQ